MKKKGILVYLHGTCSSGKSSIAKIISDHLESALHLEADHFEDIFFDKKDTNDPNFIAVNKLWEAATEQVEKSSLSDREEAFDNLVQVIEENPFPSEWNVEEEMYKYAATLMLEYNYVIIDDVIPAYRMYLNAQDILKGFQVFFIKCTAPLDVLEKRERGRPEKLMGSAVYFEGKIHQGKCYDLEIDTDLLPPEKCAEAVISFLHEKPVVNSFFQNNRKENYLK
jgi:chloramphenicol 3-O-phosphotransferase